MTTYSKNSIIGGTVSTSSSAEQSTQRKYYNAYACPKMASIDCYEMGERRALSFFFLPLWLMARMFVSRQERRGLQSLS
jgi:hypothetical protein